MSDRTGAISTALVLDSTALTSDWLLRGSTFSALRTIDGLRVGVPAVVLLEVEANHERSVAESDRLLEKVLRERHRLGFPSQDLREGSHPDYLDRLRDRLDWLDADVLPWPEVSHAEVVRRAVSRHPPFDSKGGGYRDTLVWLTALELARAGGRIYLATRDKAFAGEPGHLAVALQDETRELEGTIELVADLKAWALDRAPLLPADESTDAMRLEEFAQSFFYPWSFEQFWVAPHEVGLPPQAEDVELTDIESVGPLKVGRSRRLLDGGTYVEFTTEVRMALEIETSEAIALASGWEVLADTTPGHVLARPWVDTIVTFGVFFEAGDSGFEIESMTVRPLPPRSPAST